MYLLPREIHREILSRLELGVQQMFRRTNRYFAGLIQPSIIDLLDFGIKRGFLEYCKIELSPKKSKTQICKTAAIHGHLEILKWARSQGCPWNTHTCMEAAGGGHLEVLKWARSQGCPWDNNTCSYAAIGGHLEVLKWARGVLDFPNLNQSEKITLERNENTVCPWDSWTCT